MEPIQIVQIKPSEVEALQLLSRQTFIETFAIYNSKEDMHNYLTNNLSLDTLTNELSNPNSKFYFAIEGDKKIGYLKLNLGDAQSDLKDPASLEIERIYVLNIYFGKKVGQVLYQKALAMAKDLALKYIWLGVWEKNERAIQFYKKNGFVEFDQHIFILGNDEQTDLLMRLELETII